MQLMRRTRPATVPAKEPAPKNGIPSTSPTAPRLLRPAGPIARKRVTSLESRKKEEAEKVVLAHLKLIADADDAIDRAVAEREAAMEVIEDTMRKNKLVYVQGARKFAELKEKFSRQSRVVDPKRYRAQVTQEDFFKSIKVNIEAASQFLGEKELNAVSDIKRAESLGVQLVVDDNKKKK